MEGFEFARAWRTKFFKSMIKAIVFVPLLQASKNVYAISCASADHRD